MNEDVILAPEGLLNGTQIRAWVSNLKEEPKSFATCSLYLLRELELQDIECDFYNFVDGVVIPCRRINDLTTLEILDRELEQSDRYMSKDPKPVNFIQA